MLHYSIYKMVRQSRHGHEKRTALRPFSLSFLFGADENRLAVTGEVADIVADRPGEEVAGADLPKRYPLRTDLEAVGLDRIGVSRPIQPAQKDEVNFVADALLAAFGDALVDAGETDGSHRVAGFLQKLAPYGFGEHFALLLTAAGQSEVFAEAAHAAVHQDFSVVDDDGFCAVACRQRKSFLSLG